MLPKKKMRRRPKNSFELKRAEDLPKAKYSAAVLSKAQETHVRAAESTAVGSRSCISMYLRTGSVHRECMALLGIRAVRLNI